MFPEQARPVFWAMTDPDRTPDVLSLARSLPPGTGLILRHFGQDVLKAKAGALVRIAREHDLIFLISADPELADEVGADGVHWPETRRQDLTHWRAKRPHWIHTTSAHNLGALKPAGNYDLVFLSPVFNSASPSASKPHSEETLLDWIRQSSTPVYALGGVTLERLDLLISYGFSGCAGVSGQSAQSWTAR